MASKTSIKICLNKEIHIFRGEPTFSNLDNYVKSAFIKKLPQEFFLTYKDEEGDNITVSCDEDLQAFIESQKSLKLFIQENISSSDEEEQPKKQQQQQSQQQQPNLQDLLSSVMMGDGKKLEEVVNPLLQSFTAQMQNMTEQQNKNECQFKDLGKMFQQFKPFCQKSQTKPNWQKCQEDKEKLGLYNHQNVICDGCQVHGIQGMRYKCTTCDDFDYCGDCLSFLGEKHGHDFEPIENSIAYYKQKHQQRQQQTSCSYLNNLFQQQPKQESQQTETKKEETQVQEKQEEKLEDSKYVLIQEETEEKEQVSEVKPEEPKVQEKKLKKNYSTVVRAKAAKITEILGGKTEDYFGVCDCKDFSKDTVDYIVGQLLETPQLTEVYSSYE